MASPAASHRGAVERTRRLSPLDAAFLYFERPAQLLHVGCLALLDGAPPFDALAALLDARFAVLDRYRQRPVRSFLDLDHPTWVEDPGFQVRHHLRRIAVPAPGGETELRGVVDALFAAPFDPAHPKWEMYLIEGLGGGRAALLTKVHHCMIDGVSGAQVLEAITDASPEARDWNPSARVGPRPSERERSVGPLTRAGEWVVAGVFGAARALAKRDTARARVRDAFEAASTVAAFLREPSSAVPFNGRLSGMRRIVWTGFSLDDFLAMRGAAGCKVNDVVLAVIAGALRRYLEEAGIRPHGLRVRALVPVSVRPPEGHLTLGNLVSAMFPVLPVGIADAGERLRRVTAEMQTLKERGQARAWGLLLGLAGALPPALGPLLAWAAGDRSPVSTVCTNVPGPREVRYLAGRRIVGVHPIVPLFMDLGLGFAIMSYADQISITVSADPCLVPEADSFAVHLKAAAGELRARLGLSAAGDAPAPAAPCGVRVADVMTHTVLTIGPRESLAEAYRLMRLRRIRHLPVAGDGRLIGLVTHRDLLAASASSLAIPAEAERVRLLADAQVGDVMETHLSTAAPGEPAADAGRRMVRHKIGCLPVTRPDGSLAGIVTEDDFLRWATEHMAAVAAA
jgi:diacylglycerol O-acyltransferase